MLEKESHALLSGVAANAGAAALTAEVDVDHGSDVTFDVSIAQVAATSLNAQLYKSVDGGVSYARVPSVAISAGTGTASDYTITEAITGDNDMAIDLSCRACTHVKIIVSADGGGATDLITVRVGVAVWS